MNARLIIIVVVFLLFVATALLFLRTNKPRIKYCVIHLDRARQRLRNIRKQQRKISRKIHIVKAVDVHTLPDETDRICQEHNVEIPNVWGSKVEIACYLSHLKLLQGRRFDETYVVVFEDDFLITNVNFEAELHKLLQKLERTRESFDVLYLGNLTNYRGEPSSVDECTRVQNTNMPCWGSHAYVVRTSSLKKLTKKLKTITESYDGKLQTLAYAGEIKSLALKTDWVTQFGDDQSYIREVPFHLMNNKA